MTGKKQIQQLARQLLSVSLVEGRLSDEKVAGVLGYLEKNPPARPISVLKAYRRLVAVEVAKSLAVVEHAGPVSQASIESIASSMAHRYNRPITAITKPAPGLLAGVRIRVGDDVYESSVAGQLAVLSASV